MIKAMLLALVVFLIATFPATWLLMLFFGNLHMGFVVLGDAAPRNPRLGAARRCFLAGVRVDRFETRFVARAS